MIVRADGSSGISKADLSDWKGKKQLAPLVRNT